MSKGLIAATALSFVGLLLAISWDEELKAEDARARAAPALTTPAPTGPQRTGESQRFVLYSDAAYAIDQCAPRPAERYRNIARRATWKCKGDDVTEDTEVISPPRSYQRDRGTP